MSTSPAGLSPAQTSSWVWAVSVGVGVTGVWLSFRYKEPIITAWSTPGVAFLATVMPFTPYAEVIGAYLISAAGFIVLGLSGAFEKLVRMIPRGIAAGLLAGILLQFGVNAFGGASADPLLVIVLVMSYALLKRFTSRFAVVGILIIGVALLVVQNRIDFAAIHLSLVTPVFQAPQFSLQALLGAHALNVAAITAAICTGKDAHEDPRKRYIAGLACGVFYILVGTFGVTLATLFMVLPKAFITTLAGLALLGTIGGSLANAMAEGASSSQITGPVA